MSSDAAVIAQGLAVGREPAAPLVRGIDLTVAAGERCALVGADGVGKSAVLATLATCAAKTRPRSPPSSASS
jgi:ABC-type transport system involved in cytochrome bd biosynthesis fused ATPase/permease subunit